jgi:hypothetical protein
MRRNNIHERGGAFFLRGMRQTYNFIMPRGKMIVVNSEQRKTTSDDPYFFKDMFPREFEWKPYTVMHPEDYIELATALKCWDAALTCLQDIIHYKIDSGEYGKPKARIYADVSIKIDGRDLVGVKSILYEPTA